MEELSVLHHFSLYVNHLVSVYRGINVSASHYCSRETRAPPSPILHIFMQFSAKIMPNNRLAPNPLEILDPSLDTGSISPVLQQ